VVAADDGVVVTSSVVELSGLAGWELLCVAAEPVRWRLLSALGAGTRCVCELLPVAGVSGPALSHHLKVLREAGLVTASRRGRRVDYTLAADAADRLQAALPAAGPDPGRTAFAGCGPPVGGLR